jgi:hypothetical protein
MFFLAWSAFMWAVWLRFADKSRWREMLPVCILANALALSTDVLVFYYPLWEYVGPPALIHLADDLAIYPTVTYLFIQWLPSGRTAGRMIGYWLVWTSAAVTIELIYVHSGHMRYHLWWSTWHSYAADWFLYWLFYKFHAVFKLERLAQK